MTLKEAIEVAGPNQRMVAMIRFEDRSKDFELFDYPYALLRSEELEGCLDYKVGGIFLASGYGDVYLHVSTVRVGSSVRKE